MELEGFERGSFEHAGLLRTTYRRGQGPGVLVMHEVPGITPKVAAFARRVADRGYTVLLPQLFGEVGRSPSVPYAASQLLRACISREFHVLAARGSSPITRWLRALCRQLFTELGGPGLGAIGMCLTGNFALSLMVEPCLMAPVLSQPSLPFAVSPYHNAGLHLSDVDLAAAKARALPILGMRFSGDALCPAARFERLRTEFGARFEGIEIDSSSGNAHGIRRLAHCVVTEDFIDAEGHPTRIALDRLFLFLARQLKAAPGSAQEPAAQPSFR